MDFNRFVIIPSVGLAAITVNLISDGSAYRVISLLVIFALITWENCINDSR